MKKEVLRIQNLNLPYHEGRRYHWVSMILFEGECTAFRGMSFSGKDVLVKLLTLRRSCNVDELGLSIDSKRVRTQRELERAVYRMAPRGNALPGWTCAEYIAMAGAGWLLLGSRKRELTQKAQELADALDIRLDVRRTLSGLSEKEMRFAEIVRACMLGARVLVVEDELEGLTDGEINELGSVLRRVARQKHLTVIINVHSGAVSGALAENYIVFRDGRIVKKCRSSDITSRQLLEYYMLGPMTDTRRSLESRISSQTLQGQIPDTEPGVRILYRMRQFPAEGHRLQVLKGGSHMHQHGVLKDFSFLRSGVTTFLVLNEKLRERLFMSLSGRELRAQTYCVIGDRRLESDSYPEFVKNRIVSAMHLGGREELFDNMSIGENLVLPSIRKISFSDYMLSSSRLTHALDPDSLIKDELALPVRNSDVNSRIAVTLNRWYLYNPRVMVLLEPFERCDLYGVSIVRSYISKLSARGACVILIMSRQEYTEDISNDILRFD